MMRAINPATGDVVAEYEEHGPDEVMARLDAAHQAFGTWSRRSFGERAEVLRRAASILRERRGDYAELMATEMGKPVSQGEKEAQKCAWVCEYYAEHAASHLADEPIETGASTSYVSYRPLGVVLAIMPWNFPFWQLFRFAAPALMAGNAALLKHALNVPGAALAVERVWRDAGLPDGLFSSLLVGADAVSDLLADPRVVAATLTGSPRAGSAVARRAGELIKPSVLELGGSDPYLILEDADLDAAVKTCVTSRLLNSGQSCISAKRFIAVESVRASFEEAFIEGMRAARVGDPLDPDTEVGPQAREDLRDNLHRQVRESAAAGASVALGGRIPDERGFWYPPTVLTGVRPGMAAFDEETFGPVAAIIGARDEDEAIALANNSRYGLGAAVFTRDRERGERIAKARLEAGNCFVNALVASDPRLPFGGIKDSGYGRELSALGIREFTNAKTVYVS